MKQYAFIQSRSWYLSADYLLFTENFTRQTYSLEQRIAARLWPLNSARGNKVCIYQLVHESSMTLTKVVLLTPDSVDRRRNHFPYPVLSVGLTNSKVLGLDLLVTIQLI